MFERASKEENRRSASLSSSSPHFIFGSIAENNRFGSIDADDHPGFAFESSVEHFDMIAHGEIFSQFVRFERNFIFQRFVFGQNSNRISIDANDRSLQIDQFAFTNFDLIARRKGQNIVFRRSTLVDRHVAFRSIDVLFEFLQFADRRYDAVGRLLGRERERNVLLVDASRRTMDSLTTV